MTDAPAPVTRTRRWRAVVYFYVDDTPDPSYDVAACDQLADDLAADLSVAIDGLDRIASGSVKIVNLDAEDEDSE